MATPLKARHLVHAALVIGLLAHSNIASGQQNISLGQTATRQFTGGRDMHEYTVTLTAGDRLLVRAESVGTTLRTDIRVLDPGGSRVEYWRPAVTHDHASQPLSASGAYRVQVENNRVGEYTISFGKIDLQGNEVRPGSQAPQGSAGSQQSTD